MSRGEKIEIALALFILGGILAVLLFCLSEGRSEETPPPPSLPEREEVRSAEEELRDTAERIEALRRERERIEEVLPRPLEDPQP